MVKHLKCPYCGSFAIAEDEVYGEEWSTSELNVIVERISGYCSSCGKDLQWEEHYKLCGYDNIEGVE